MKRSTNRTRRQQAAQLGLTTILIFAGCGARATRAEDWGAYAIIPASAPGLTLEVAGPAGGGGPAAGAFVSIGKPAAAAGQKWTIAPGKDGLCAIRPASNPALVLSVEGGSAKIGARIVVEADGGRPWQRWEMKKNEDGSYCLLPPHAPAMGLDHLGGDPRPGARIDIWTYAPNDDHLRWLVRPLAGTARPSAAGPEGPGRLQYAPPVLRPEDVKRGRIEEFTYSDSRIFPGTTRKVVVFIPAQYDGSRPACVYVKTDGFPSVEKDLLEEMIAAGEMPVTVGVFVQPGDLPAPMPGTLGRRNRCLEYDGMGDANARFLVDELLPFVAEKYHLRLSASGNDRAIAGGSSGGIAAFNAAWERPDAFTRVYANSGSFVAFRGGHEFPTLVRKFEPKPIRAYLTTGTRDMENCAGDWFLIDQEMAKALEFAGYDHVFRIIDGGHVAGYHAHFREAMSYLWKGWPRPVTAGPGGPRVRDILLSGEPWRPVSEGRRGASSPACNARGEVFFADADGAEIDVIGADDNIRTFAADVGHVSGISVGPEGELNSVSTRTGKVVRHDATGRAETIAEGLPGRHILAMPDGALYVTVDGRDSGEVWLVKDRRKERVDSGLKRATGLAYRPDRWLLSVADGSSKWVYSYQIRADGKLGNKERFSWLHVPDWEDDAGAESVCYAREGQMMVATRWGVQVCADDGPTQVILPVPDRGRILGVCLGGPGMDTLYAFCGDRIWKRKVKVHALGAFSPWTTMRGTPL